MSTTSDRTGLVAVVGAGPYGLAVATHLRAMQVPTHVLGEPMKYWRANMPNGMLLRSPWRASSIASPGDELSLAVYERQRQAPLQRPIPLSDFIEYAQWYREAGVPDVDSRRVSQVDRTAEGFTLSLSDGERLAATRVVLATGLEGFARRPTPFDVLPPTLVSHTADHAGLDEFAGKRVVVVGAGQSAVETAVLVHEAGAQVQLLARAGGVHWLTRSAKLHGRREILGRLLYAPTDVGPAGLSWIAAAPELMRRMPSRTRRRIIRRCVRPAASDWLLPRSDGISFTFGRYASAATPEPSGGLRITLDDGTVIDADHVLLGTGFRPDLADVSILAPELRAAIDHRDGHPLLGRGFETSVPGLHIVGALSADSFGPVMRFVAGTWFTAPALARHVAPR